MFNRNEMLPVDSSLPNNPVEMASPDQKDCQSQHLRHQQSSQHDPQAHDLDLTSDSLTKGSVSIQPHPPQQTPGPDSFHHPFLTHSSLAQFQQRPGQQHPSATGTQLPTLPPQAVDKVGPCLAIVSRLLYVGSEDGATLGDPVPGISDEEVKGATAWMDTDKAKIMALEGPELEEGKMMGGFETRGKVERCEVDGPMYGQQRKTVAEGTMFPGFMFSDELPAEARMESESGPDQDGKEAILAKESTLKDLEKPVPIRMELDLEDYRLSDTFIWKAGDLAVSPELLAATTDLNLGVLFIAGPLIVRQIHGQLAEYRFHHRHNITLSPTESVKERLLSIVDCGKPRAKGNDEVWWAVWRKWLRTGEENESTRSGKGAEDEDLKRQEPLISARGEVKSDSQMVDMRAEQTKGVVSESPLRILIKLDIRVGSTRLVDQFQWDTSKELNSLEIFAECYTRELGLRDEFKTRIVHAVQQQVRVYAQASLSVSHQLDRNIIHDEGLRLALINPVATATRSAKLVTTPMHTFRDHEGAIDPQREERKKDTNENPEAAVERGVNLPGWEPVERNKALTGGKGARRPTSPAIGLVELLPGRLDELVVAENDQVAPPTQTFTQWSKLPAVPLPVARHDIKYETTSPPQLSLSKAVSQAPAQKSATCVPPSTEIQASPAQLDQPVCLGFECPTQCTTCGSASASIIRSKRPEGCKSRCTHEISCRGGIVYGSDPEGSMSVSMEKQTGFKQTPQPQPSTPGKRSFTTSLSPEHVPDIGDLGGGTDGGDGNDEVALLIDLAKDLWARFEQKGAVGDLNNIIAYYYKALNLCPPGHPLQVLSIRSMAFALQRRFKQKGDFGDLDNAIKYYHLALDLCPSDHPGHSMLLVSLGVILQTRFQHEGDFGDLDNAIKYHHQALDLHPPGHPAHSMSLNSLCIALQTRFDHRGAIVDLDKAIKYHHQALDLQPSVHAGHSISLISLGLALQMRFGQKGDPRDLDNAIKYHQQALELQSSGHPDRSMFLVGLAKGLWRRFEHKGDFGDLDNAIKYHHQALDLQSPGDSSHPGFLNSLGVILLTRFEHEGDFGDLDNAIKYHHQALDLHAPGHPSHSIFLDNLGLALKTRFEHKGDPRDLDNAIKYHHWALDLQPSGNPGHPVSLNNLGLALQTRFEHKGDHGDLAKAIMYHQQSLELHPPSYPNHSTFLNNLGFALQTRSEQNGDCGDLEKANMYHHQALDLCPPGHPGHSPSLNSLGVALQRRFKQKGDLSDLDHAIKYHCQALDLQPPGHPNRCTSLNNLGKAHQRRFKQTGDLGDLDSAIRYHYQDLDLRLPGDTCHSATLINLALALQMRFEQRGEINDLNDAINIYQGSHAIPSHHPHQLQLAQGLAKAYLLHPNMQHNLDEALLLFQEAANHVPGGSRAQLFASLDWISSAKQCFHSSELLAYLTSLGLLQKYLTLHPTILSQFSALTRLPLTLGLDAAACAIKANQLGTAVEFLEQGRALLWKNLEGYCASLQDLQDSNHPELAQEFQRLGHLLEHTKLSSMETTQQSEKFLNGQAYRYHQLSQEWDQVIAQIQILPGFSHFLRPIPFQTLQLSATNGPVIIVNISQYHSDAIILSNNHDPIHVPLPFATLRATQLLSSTLKQILKVSQDGGSSEHTKGLTGVLRSLWDWVVEPIVVHLDWLPQGAHIWWCPTSALCSLPLHAAGPWRKGKLNLPNMFLSSYAPTLSALQKAQLTTHPPHIAPTILAVGVAELAGGLRKLEGVKEDLHEMMQAATSKGQHVDVLLGEDACKDVVLGNLRQHSWIHFACHGHQDFHEPFKSSFSLYDMPLTLHDIIQAKIPNAELAFLSACHSASADQVAPDETIHLAAALQYSGFKTVIGTLWAMDDRDGPDVARSFYEYMFRNGKERLDHKDAAQALKHVVDTLRKKGVPVDRWACFVHIGA